MIDRRRFLQILGSSAVAAYALDPEKLLWIPGQKKIFIPPPRRLIYASELHASDEGVTMKLLEEIFGHDKILYEIIYNEPKYKHITGDYKTVKVYHGYKT